MLTVNELAIQGDAPAHVVRYYVRIGLLQPATHLDNGYRLFESTDASRLRFIRTAKYLGFTLNEIRQIIQHADSGTSPCNDVRAIIQHRIVENRKKIEEMINLQTRMERSLEQWQRMPNKTPDRHSICHLIESALTDENAKSCHATN